MTYSSGLTLPGLPGQMKLFDTFVLILIAIYVLQRTMKAGKQIRFSWLGLDFAHLRWLDLSHRLHPRIWFPRSRRRHDWRILLSSSASSRLACHYSAPGSAFRCGVGKIVLLMVGLLAPATLLADLLVLRGWAFELVRLFVQTSSDIANMMDSTDGDQGTTMSRLFAAGPAANGMMLALLCLVPHAPVLSRRGGVWLAVFAGIVALSLMSGFRLMTATLFLIAALTLFLQKRASPPRG